jgi:LysM repeat protein
MSYTIRRGDTLSEIAARFHTSVGALVRANPSIHNPNLIFSGAKLVIPGSKDEFVHAKPPRHPGSSSSTGSATSGTAAHGGSAAAYQIAHSVLGHNISQLKYSGPLAKYLDKWPGNKVCCANFVSACLEKAGQIRHSEHNDNVRGLANNLRHDSRWSSVSLRNAKPGDVVCFTVPGEGHYAHTVLFAGWKNGKPTFIGSNNANPDGTQRITQGYMGYAVDAVFHYHG